MMAANAVMMDWTRLLSTARFRADARGHVQPTRTTSTNEGAPGLRSDYHIDHDRVVFSSAFRRLGRKTQVHPLAQHDHTHNRLTHSVEVASVGRSLGNRVGAMLNASGSLPPDTTPFDFGAVVQVACLAHDIGNPPFGHTGEEALRDWFRRPEHAHWLEKLAAHERRDVMTYEGNAHSLRMVTSLEMYAGDGGMRLTAAAIGALIKYPWTADAPVETAQKRNKFNIYHTELPYFRRVADELGLIRLDERVWARHPLSYLMEAADDICYAILDLEDAVEIGILDFQEFERLFARIAEPERSWGIHNIRQKCAMLRGVAIGRCVTEVAQKFIDHQQLLLAGEFAMKGKDLIAVCSADISRTLNEAKELASQRVYRHRTKLVTEIAAFPCLGSLLDMLVPATHAWVMAADKKQISGRDRLLIDLLQQSAPLTAEDTLYTAYMKVLDYLGSMTDNAAATLARELSGVGIL